MVNPSGHSLAVVLCLKCDNKVEGAGGLGATRSAIGGNA
jgi:hypothetical protein